MPWESSTKYKYTVGILKAIAANYLHLYEDGFSVKPWKPELTIIWQLVEYKADFDMALSSIGSSKWKRPKGERLANYKGFGRLQRLVIADILRLSDNELEGAGFRNISRARGLAYRWMSNCLNDIPLRGSQTRFIAKNY